MTSITRGIRNNNPFNIRRSRSRWLGLGVPNGDYSICRDKSFCQFQEMNYGLRAGLLLIANYIRYHRCDTISKIVSRFAPSSENDTSAYINYCLFDVCGNLGFDSVVKIESFRIEVGTDIYFELCRSILKYESSFFISRQALRQIYIDFELGALRC